MGRRRVAGVENRLAAIAQSAYRPAAMDVLRPSAAPTDADLVAHGREILRAEGSAILRSAEVLGDGFARAVRLLADCTGSVVATGVGKAGIVAHKISATLSSTGTPSHFLHASEAVHGDLGTLRPDDLVLAVSQSGESGEITALLPHLRRSGIPIVALTGRPSSALGRAAATVVVTGSEPEACPLGLAPSTSTSVMLALGDALALVVSRLRGFTSDDFAARHPGGSLGRRLAMIQEVMRPLAECRVARPDETVREVFARPLPLRRTGAVMVVGGRGELLGIFTDSDLARLFEYRQDASIDRPIREVMTREPATVAMSGRLEEAVTILESRRLSELPVIDGSGRVVGLVDIVDCVGADRSSVLPARSARERAA
jgi:arabinose-5-phosphate isomerase